MINPIHQNLQITSHPHKFQERSVDNSLYLAGSSECMLIGLSLSVNPLLSSKILWFPPLKSNSAEEPKVWLKCFLRRDSLSSSLAFVFYISWHRISIYCYLFRWCESSCPKRKSFSFRSLTSAAECWQWLQLRRLRVRLILPLIGSMSNFPPKLIST